MTTPTENDVNGPDSQVSRMEGDAALPRLNGELVFEAPWEGRAFGMAVTLSDSGAYPWAAFTERLIAEIGEAERTGVSSSYYQRWLASLERLAMASGFVEPEELEQRTGEYLSGERDGHGHPHGYGHGHDHGPHDH